jgi:selenocysteine lyase/cysteine desulfurase
VEPEAQDRLDPETAGWFADREQFAFDTSTFRPRQDARRYELGTPSLPSVHAGRAGLEIVDEIGPHRIRTRQTELTDALVERLADRGFTIATPQASEERAGIVMVDGDAPARVVDRLADRDIIIDHRPGRVRISPYFYNTEDELQRVVDALASLRVDTPTGSA